MDESKNIHHDENPQVPSTSYSSSFMSTAAIGRDATTASAPVTLTTSTSITVGRSSGSDMTEEDGPTTTSSSLSTSARMKMIKTMPRQPRHCYNVIQNSLSPAVYQIVNENNYNIALLINDCVTCQDIAISAIANPISTCHAVSLIVLNPTATTPAVVTDDNDTDNINDDEAKGWLEMNSINPETTKILYGNDGFQTVLCDTSIHAIYIFVPANLQQQHVISTLQHNKHVLLKDIVSTPSKDYTTQLSYAKIHNKFIQFSTMFVFHYHVQTFLNCVRTTFTFGNIIEIDTILTINLQDLKTLNVTLPLSSQQGCIRRLARFPVLITTLMLKQQQQQFQGLEIKPVSAQVTDHIIDDVSGEPISAHCEILFTNNVILKCYVVYSNAPTRQVLTVKSDMNRYATMTDFVLPHKDGLATYRIYDKVYNEHTHKYDIIRGECLDVPTGPPQNVAMWRNFHQLCHTVDTYGWTQNLTPTPPAATTTKVATTEMNEMDNSTADTSVLNQTNSNHNSNEYLSEALLLTESAIQTKRILIALDESFYNHGTIIYF